MKDKKAREEIESLKKEIENMKNTIKTHRHELGKGVVYCEYV